RQLFRHGRQPRQLRRQPAMAEPAFRAGGEPGGPRLLPVLLHRRRHAVADLGRHSPDPLGAADDRDSLSRGAAAELAEQLADTFGHRFRQPELLREALTHPSASAPFGKSASARSARPRPAKQRGYERLEFLGDRVLGLVVADLLYAAYPQEDEGALAKRLAVLARKDTLARVATVAALGDHLVLSKAESQSGGRRNPTLLA